VSGPGARPLQCQHGRLVGRAAARRRGAGRLAGGRALRAAEARVQRAAAGRLAGARAQRLGARARRSAPDRAPRARGARRACARGARADAPPHEVHCAIALLAPRQGCTRVTCATCLLSSVAAFHGALASSPGAASGAPASRQELRALQARIARAQPEQGRTAASCVGSCSGMPAWPMYATSSRCCSRSDSALVHFAACRRPLRGSPGRPSSGGQGRAGAGGARRDSSVLYIAQRMAGHEAAFACARRSSGRGAQPCRSGGGRAAHAPAAAAALERTARRGRAAARRLAAAHGVGHRWRRLGEHLRRQGAWPHAGQARAGPGSHARCAPARLAAGRWRPAPQRGPPCGAQSVGAALGRGLRGADQ